MLNFYLLGVMMAGAITIYDILFEEVIEETLEQNKDVPQRFIAIGIMLAVVFVMVMSWVTVISRVHKILMKTF